MPDNDSQTPPINWRLTTFEGARREQLRRWAQLPLEDILRALEEMEDLSRQLGTAPAGESAVSAPALVIKETSGLYGTSGADALALTGCTPEPLMAYLKALGVLRLVSEQKDPNARGWWKNDVFWIRSPSLFKGAVTEEEKRDALAKFLLEEYQPTPIVAPWNAGSGFYLKWDEKKSAFKFREANDAISKIECSTTPRLEPYRDQILTIKRALQKKAKPFEPSEEIGRIREQGEREGWAKKKANQEVKQLLDSQMLFSEAGITYAIEKVDKDKLLRDTRSSLVNDKAIEWIDTAFVIRTGQKKNRDEAPLLGSGGNIGNSDFSARFMQALTRCLPLNDVENPTDKTAALLHSALFGRLIAGLDSLAVDQFDPGRAGGANMHQGMEATARLNPWDYILMLEGAMVLQGASSKRLGSNSTGSVFPFVVESTPAGFDSSGFDTTRGEQWLPLWNRPSTATEIRALLTEGRSEIGIRSARTGVEFAQAVASLGVDRGIKEFVRIQYQARFGDNYLANALGRVQVVLQQSVELLRQVDPWLSAFRRAAGDKNAPPRFRSSLRRIDSAIFDFCKYGGPVYFQQILIALGQAERELAIAKRFRDEKKLKPLADLSKDWIKAADDGSPEFRLARALASLDDAEGKIGPLRANLEAVDWKMCYRAWAEKDRAVVWNAGDLATNLGNVLQRRVMDGQCAGCRALPLASNSMVPLETIAAFLEGDLDDQRIEVLLWGLALIEQRSGPNIGHPIWTEETNDLPIHRTYALLKLLFLPRPLVGEPYRGEIRWRLAREGEAGITIRPEPRILPLLRAGRLGEACRIAAQRLRVSGLPPIPRALPDGRTRDYAWSEFVSDPRRAQRLAASLLIPIDSASVNRLVHLVCRDELALTGT